MEVAGCLQWRIPGEVNLLTISLTAAAAGNVMHL